MPMKSKQPLNARLMLEVGVGVEVVRERRQYLGKEMAKAIDKVIVDKAFCEGLRCREPHSFLGGNVHGRHGQIPEEEVQHHKRFAAMEMIDNL
ncbi:hypothetical protein RD792_017160 [Penstemon davidsonii]|uniref:Uncharacterized protein n=1 Tax=Penstemon davidsonii TaxID=160366 RepID=A0ABR0CMH3_9LAMI|nr:hypothetical protein RD792_017160 [Penstemon davidsonii]